MTNQISNTAVQKQKVIFFICLDLFTICVIHIAYGKNSNKIIHRLTDLYKLYNKKKKDNHNDVTGTVSNLGLCVCSKDKKVAIRTCLKAHSSKCDL